MKYVDVFESRGCPRCGGTGRFSFTPTWGSTCFTCGFAPYIPGTGRVLTKRGEAARQYYVRATSSPARELRAGDAIIEEVPVATATSGVAFVVRREVVLTITPHPDKEDVYVIETTGTQYQGVSGDRLFRRVVPKDVRDAAVRAAVEYQATLTKAGTVRRRRATSVAARGPLGTAAFVGCSRLPTSLVNEYRRAHDEPLSSVVAVQIIRKVLAGIPGLIPVAFQWSNRAPRHRRATYLIRRCHGIHTPDCKIILYRGGQNLATLLHELAHHLQYCLDNGRNHDAAFVRRLDDLLGRVEWTDDGRVVFR